MQDNRAQDINEDMVMVKDDIAKAEELKNKSM